MFGLLIVEGNDPQDVLPKFINSEGESIADSFSTINQLDWDDPFWEANADQLLDKIDELSTIAGHKNLKQMPAACTVQLTRALVKILKVKPVGDNFRVHLKFIISRSNDEIVCNDFVEVNSRQIVIPIKIGEGDKS
jgi:hypothetical protein